MNRPRSGIVLIGRNEGTRLARALDAALAQAVPVVYVDSGSGDASVARAQVRGVAVVELDAALPFTAARARNAGALWLLQHEPQLEFLQFVDGDCELAPDFLRHATAALDADASVAVVCGRRREVEPTTSLYNRLSDIEWDAPPGETNACGGDALVRASAFCAVGGYDPHWIAGEEPEFCLRLRRTGWKILRLAAEMTRHDAHMTRFSQWWRRSVRAGHAYAQGAWRYGRDAEHHWLRESLSIWFWGGALPGAALVLAKPSRGASLLLLCAYPALAARIFVRARQRGLTRDDAALYTLFCLLGKFPQLQGQILFLVNERGKQPTRLIEY